MSYRYRCWKKLPNGKKCGGRKTLTKLIEFYVKEPPCPNCGSKTLRLDKHRMENEVGKKASLCHCSGYPWDGPHRKGSKWCIHSDTEKTDEDYEDQYRKIPGVV